MLIIIIINVSINAFSLPVIQKCMFFKIIYAYKFINFTTKLIAEHLIDSSNKDRNVGDKIIIKNILIF